MPRKPKKTRHGATQPEDAREKKQLLLRMLPEKIERLKARAAEAGQNVGDYVSSLVS